MSSQSEGVEMYVMSQTSVAMGLQRAWLNR